MKILTFLFIFCYLLSQEKYFIENPPFNEALSSLKINVIYQDKTGFIWIGTENGLYRYDGDKVTDLNSLVNESLKSRHIISLFEDSKNRFWIGTEEGLAVLDGNEINFYYHDNADSTSIIDNYIHQVSEDKENNILIATDAGLSIIKENDNIINIAEKDGLSHFHTMTAIVDHKNRYWVGTSNFSNLYENNKWEMFRFDNIVDKESKNEYHVNRVTRFKISSNNWLWALTNIGVNIFDLNADRQIYKDFNDKFNLYGITINDIVETSKSNYLIASNKGLYIINTEKETVEVINESNGLNGNQILTLHNDNSGFVWIGTNNGINKFFYNKANISMLYPNKFLDRSESNEIYSVKENTNGDILVATLTKLIVLDKNLKKKIKLINQDRIKDISIDSKKRIYVSTYASGLKIFNHNYKLILAFPNHKGKEKVINTTYVERTKYSEKHKKYLVGTLSSGLNIVDEKSHKTLLLTAEEKNKDLRISHNTIYDFYEDQDFVWIATHNGLDRFNFKSKKNKTVLMNYTIKKIARYKNSLYLATKNDGLITFNLSEEKIERKIEKVDGLVNNDVRDIIVEGKILWVLTAKGINRLELDNNKLSKVSVINKFLSTRQKEYTTMTLLQESKLLIGSQSGLISYSTNNNLNFSKQPKAIIKDIIHLNQSLINSEYQTDNQRYVFPPEYNSLSIEFSCLDFYEPTENNYQYRFEGLNNDWIHSGSRNYVSFAHLDPGTYKLQLKASNSFGIVSDLTELQFVIRKPFYLKSWFFILTSIFLILLFYFIYQSKNRRNIEILNIRRKLASDLHDQIGSTLTEITLLSEMAQVSKTDLNEKLSKIEEKSRRSISEMSDLVWSIDSAKDNWDELINRIKDFALNLLSYHDIICSFRIESEPPKTKLDPNSRQHLYLMFKEILHNIIKHSSATEVEIGFTFGKSFTMTVQDNGSGFDRNNVKKGNGLRNLESRAKALNGKLIIENKQGTIIQFKED